MSRKAGTPRDKRGRKHVVRWPASTWQPNPEKVIVKKGKR